MRHWDHNAAQLSRRPTARTGIGHRRSPGEKQIRGANAEVGMPPTRPIMDARYARACCTLARSTTYTQQRIRCSALPALGRDRAHGYGHLIVHGSSRPLAGFLQLVSLRARCYSGRVEARSTHCSAHAQQRAMVRETQCLHDWAHNEAGIRPIRVKKAMVLERECSRLRAGSTMKWEATSEGGMKLFPSVGVAGLNYPFGRGAVRKARVRGVEHRGRVVDDHVAGACESQVGGNAFDRAEGRSTGRGRAVTGGRSAYGKLWNSEGRGRTESADETAHEPQWTTEGAGWKHASSGRQTMFKGDRESMEEARAEKSRTRMLRILRCSVDAGKRRIYYRIRVTGFSASTRRRAIGNTRIASHLGPERCLRCSRQGMYERDAAEQKKVLRASWNERMSILEQNFNGGAMKNLRGELNSARGGQESKRGESQSNAIDHRITGPAPPFGFSLSFHFTPCASSRVWTSKDRFKFMIPAMCVSHAPAIVLGF
ncbi:hypothetical protein B0H13DRAFT_2286734 [Mycena leptocephala]|nr:hypothetical protein B0H13DRAFT_2286734 [Mycena leptocephala]